MNFLFSTCDEVGSMLQVSLMFIFFVGFSKHEEE